MVGTAAGRINPADMFTQHTPFNSIKYMICMMCIRCQFRVADRFGNLYHVNSETCEVIVDGVGHTVFDVCVFTLKSNV